MLWANAASLVVAVALTLVLVPGHGARGAAVATLAAEVVLAAVLLAVLLRGTPALLAGLRGAPAALIAAGLGVLAWWRLGPPDVLALLIANAVFALGLVLTGRFPPEVRDAVRRHAA
jgi:Na+-driven multidrug efflux pump